MKSPITGKAMHLEYEWRKVPFRKETLTIPYQYYLCADTSEQFTTTELDELNLQMLHNQYRTLHHIPQPDAIRAMREKYGVSASRMGEVLGFGPNTYGQYEKGDLPTMANAKLLKLAENPAKFLPLAEDWATTSTKAKADLLKRVNELIEGHKVRLVDYESYLMGGKATDQYTGFKSPDFAKLAEMVVFFAQKVPCYKTKMNKLLFYADFLMFKLFGQSISGTRYRAIPYGPVPHSFESVFESLASDAVIDITYEELKEGGQKQFLTSIKERRFNEALFTTSELSILNKVQERFANIRPYEIVEISHEEEGWQANEKERALISYHYALDLKAV